MWHAQPEPSFEAGGFAAHSFRCNLDWAIAFLEGTVKHVYFIAETKGSMSSMELRKIEECKIDCARKFFSKITSDQVKYDVVDSYGKLMELVK